MPPDPGIVAGVVSDRTGAPVSGARVWFAAGPVALPDVAALTDSRGAFTLSAPAPGHYTIQCAADDSEPQSFRVSIESGQRSEIECRLKS